MVSLPSFRRGSCLLVLTAACACAVAGTGTGCVERILQVRSEPPGATVFVNGAIAGVTPLDHRFAFYGTYDVVVRRPGFYSARTLATVEVPWFQVFPLDLVTEHALPWTLRDLHSVTLELEPLPSRVDESLREEIRARAAAARDAGGAAESTPSTADAAPAGTEGTNEAMRTEGTGQPPDDGGGGEE